MPTSCNLRRMLMELSLHGLVTELLATTTVRSGLASARAAQMHAAQRSNA